MKKSRKNIHYIADGVKYASLEQAAKDHGISREAVRLRVRGCYWHWFKVVDGVMQPKVVTEVKRTSYYFKKKNGVKISKERPKKYKTRVKTIGPYNSNRINNLQNPKEIKDLLADIFAKKDAKKLRKYLTDK